MTSRASPLIVLASASPRRADILRQLGIRAEVSPAAVDESLEPGEAPERHVERLALAKAEAVADTLGGRTQPAANAPVLVIAGDTVVVLDERVLGKPRSEEEAVTMLTTLSGRGHTVFSGLAVVECAGVNEPRRIASTTVTSSVHFRQFDAGHARAYVATGEPMDKAGAYGVQRLGSTLVSRIDGDFFAIMGMSVTALVDLLARLGWLYEFGRIRRSTT